MIGILRRFFLWIGFIINTSSGLIYATDARIESLCCDLNELCAGFQVSASIHVKRLASVVGKIISLSACCGDVTQIMTRYLHFIVNSRDSWHSIVFIQDQAKRELLFWRDNLRSLNGVSFWSSPFVPSRLSSPMLLLRDVLPIFKVLLYFFIGIGLQLSC